MLVFRKGGATERVMFLHVENDGFKLDANHDTPIDGDDLPGLIEAFGDRAECWAAWQGRDRDVDWTGNWWFAKADAIRAADFNLSAGRHRPQNRAFVEHRDPLDILDELRAIETEILGEIDETCRYGERNFSHMNWPAIPLKELLLLHDAGVWDQRIAQMGLAYCGQPTSMQTDQSVSIICRSAASSQESVKQRDSLQTISFLKNRVEDRSSQWDEYASIEGIT